MAIPALLLLAGCAGSALAQASVSQGTLPLKLSVTQPGNLLPSFRFRLSQVEGGSLQVPIGGGKIDPSPFVPGDSCPEEIWNHASADLHAPNLPYLTQDRWGCERAPTDVGVLVYEDSFLKLSITPNWAGRIWSVHDKKRNRDWTFNNSAHQVSAPRNGLATQATTSNHCPSRVRSPPTSPCSRPGHREGSNGTGAPASSATRYSARAPPLWA